jgi:hypothetical protein
MILYERCWLIADCIGLWMHERMGHEHGIITCLLDWQRHLLQVRPPLCSSRLHVSPSYLTKLAASSLLFSSTQFMSTPFMMTLMSLLLLTNLNQWTCTCSTISWWTSCSKCWRMQISLSTRTTMSPQMTFSPDLSDKICTGSHTYVHVLSLCHLYSFTSYLKNHKCELSKGILFSCTLLTT